MIYWKPDPEKQKIREYVWRLMENKGVARFPGAFGRIPNFVGAEKAAHLAAGLDVFLNARVIKANPDSPQKKLREIALKSGKIVYMAVPKLRDERCFVELDPDVVGDRWKEASTIKGAFRLGRQVYPWEMKKVDLVIAGSVAVNRMGQRIGKGGGFSDLEFAIARHFNLIDDSTPVITTVHEVQILDREFPWKPYDIPVDYIITPIRAIKTDGKFKKPSGIFPDLLQKEMIKEIPILKRMGYGD